MFSEICESFTKVKYGVPLYRCVTLLNLKLKNVNIEKRKQTLALAMVLQLQVSKCCECKNIVSATILLQQ